MTSVISWDTRLCLLTPCFFVCLTTHGDACLCLLMSPITSPALLLYFTSYRINPRDQNCTLRSLHFGLIAMHSPTRWRHSQPSKTCEHLPAPLPITLGFCLVCLLSSWARRKCHQSKIRLASAVHLSCGRPSKQCKAFITCQCVLCCSVTCFSLVSST